MTARAGLWGKVSWGQKRCSRTAGTGQPEKTVGIVQPIKKTEDRIART
jgi:hypothetical protein